MKKYLCWFLLLMVIGGLSACTTRQSATMNQYGTVERKETKLFLGFIPVLESDISSENVPLR